MYLISLAPLSDHGISHVSYCSHQTTTFFHSYWVSVFIMSLSGWLRIFFLWFWVPKPKKLNTEPKLSKIMTTKQHKADLNFNIN